MRSRGSSPVSRHGKRKSSDAQSAAGKCHRQSLVPPDIVLESEDTETHEPVTTTLVSGQSCNEVIMSYELEERNDDRRGKSNTLDTFHFYKHSIHSSFRLTTITLVSGVGLETLVWFTLSLHPFLILTLTWLSAIYLVTLNLTEAIH